MHDQDVSAALAADLEGSFEQVVVAYQNRLYGFALRLTGSPQDAEEITQDAFVRAYRALATYPAMRIRTLALRPWLHQILLNVFRNRVRYRYLQLSTRGMRQATWNSMMTKRPGPIRRWSVLSSKRRSTRWWLPCLSAIGWPWCCAISRGSALAKWL